MREIIDAVIAAISVRRGTRNRRSRRPFDLLSGGRLTLGLGSGFPFPRTETELAARRGAIHRADRMPAGDGAAVAVAGERHTAGHVSRSLRDIQGARRPARASTARRPPLSLAGVGPKAADRV